MGLGAAAASHPEEGEREREKQRERERGSDRGESQTRGISLMTSSDVMLCVSPASFSHKAHTQLVGSGGLDSPGEQNRTGERGERRPIARQLTAARLDMVVPVMRAAVATPKGPDFSVHECRAAVIV